MTDLEDLIKAIHAFGALRASTDRAWSRPAASRVIDCVLSLRRSYDRFVVPRLEAFEHSYPDVKTVRALSGLIESYPSPASFVKEVLNYRDPNRAQTLAGVTRYLVGVLNDHEVAPEGEVLSLWASAAKPADYRTVGVRGFGLAGFQYLRMLFGANTTKPDLHICAFVSRAVHRKVTDVGALDLLERAAPLAPVKLRDLDTTIWEASARSTKASTPRRNLTRTCS